MRFLAIIASLLAIAFCVGLLLFIMNLITNLNAQKEKRGQKLTEAKQMFRKDVAKTVICAVAMFVSIFVAIKTGYPSVEAEKLASEYDEITSYTYLVNGVEYTVSDGELYIKDGQIYLRKDEFKNMELMYVFENVEMPENATLVAVEFQKSDSDFFKNWS